VLQRSCIVRQDDLPTPGTFLIDANGQVAVIYKGPVSIAQLDNDKKLLGADSDTILAGAIPEAGGPWLEKPGGTAPRAFAVMLLDNGYPESAERYLRQILPLYENAVAGATKRDEEFRLNELGECHLFLGAIEFDRKNYEAAVSHYLAGLEVLPANRKMRLELARTFEQLEQPEKAAGAIEEALKLERNDPENLARLGRLKLQLGQRSDGIALLRESLASRPDKEVHFHLANALAEDGEATAAAAEWRAALKLDPLWPPACNQLAWTLATSRNAALRNGAEAVRLAETAVKGTDQRVPTLLGTLAAAYAEAGRFDAAVNAAKQAIALAQSNNDQSLARAILEKQALYEKHRPWRE
jgi:tetratricopeptide (TPR) repeat protein